jgi:pimeloyl-ACP methyl ester carboxylesterase
MGRLSRGKGRVHVLHLGQWLRQHMPPTLVMWGRYDPSFIVPGALAYARDIPDAEIHLLDAGHFALDEQADAVAQLTREFLERRIAT